VSDIFYNLGHVLDKIFKAISAFGYIADSAARHAVVIMVPNIVVQAVNAPTFVCFWALAAEKTRGPVHILELVWC
jgi:hypothetical protein